MCLCVFKFFFEITEDKVHKEPSRDRGKNYSNDSGHLFVFILILSAPRGGGFQQGFYHKFGPAMQGF